MTMLNGIPLYTTKREALVWAKSKGIKGYHKHVVKSRVGYMGGYNHAEIRAVLGNQVNNRATTTNRSRTQRVVQPIQQTPPPVQPTRTRQNQINTTPDINRRTVPVRRTTPTRRTTPVVRVSSGGSGGGGGY